MSVVILQGDVFSRLADLADESVDCVVVSPPYWGLRDYGVDGQIGLEPTLGQHLDVMVAVFAEVWRVLKKTGTVWLNYGDCYASAPNGRSAAATKEAGKDDRTFRDKPFSTVGAIYEHQPNGRQNGRRGRNGNLGNGGKNGQSLPAGRIVAGAVLKPKDLCMLPNRVAIALQEWGWWVRSEIIWAKPNPMPDSSGRYRPSTSHEKIFLLTKTGKGYYDSEAVKQAVSGGTHSRVSKVKTPDGWDTGPGTHGTIHRQGREAGATQDKVPGVGQKSLKAGFQVRANESFHATTTAMVESRYLRNYEPAPPTVWRIASRAFRGAHFATFPPELVERCLLAGCPPGGHVLDPFGGAGTTGLVARALGMTATLIELNEEYITIARERLDGPPLERAGVDGTPSLFDHQEARTPAGRTGNEKISTGRQE